MKLGLDLGHPTSGPELDANLELASAAERLGYDVVWASEAYGADAVSILGAVAARTSRIGIGAGVLQIPGRTPAMTAMTAATLDTLSHGRFRLGLGVSGPQVSEGWHGVRFGAPLARTREYMAIVRAAIARQRVTADGEHFTLPLPGGQGKPLVLSLDPQRREIPVYLAAVGPRNLRLTAEIADGWLGIFVDPLSDESPVRRLREHLTTAGRDLRAFDLNVSLAVSVDDDPERAADRIRPHAALYLGGMGSRSTNFYHGIASAMGYRQQADLVQERFMARDYAGAAAAVPLEFLQRVSLLGDRSTIAERLAELERVGVTTASVSPFADGLSGRAETLAVVAAAATDAGVHA